MLQVVVPHEVEMFRLHQISTFPCDSASKCSGGDRLGRALCGSLDGVPHEVRASGCLLVSSEPIIKAKFQAVEGGVVGEARNTGGDYT